MEDRARMSLAIESSPAPRSRSQPTLEYAWSWKGSMMTCRGCGGLTVISACPTARAELAYASPTSTTVSIRSEINRSRSRSRSVARSWRTIGATSRVAGRTVRFLAHQGLRLGETGRQDHGTAGRDQALVPPPDRVGADLAGQARR